MRTFPIDEPTAERLLWGLVAPEDAPPGYAGVAALVRDAAGPALPQELATEAAVITACALVAEHAGAARPRATRPAAALARRLSARAAAIAAAVTVLGATAAAAATGSLPPPVQAVLASAVSCVGVSIPSPDRVEPPATTPVHRADAPAPAGSPTSAGRSTPPGGAASTGTTRSPHVVPGGAGPAAGTPAAGANVPGAPGGGGGAGHGSGNGGGDAHGNGHNGGGAGAGNASPNGSPGAAGQGAGNGGTNSRSTTVAPRVNVVGGGGPPSASNGGTGNSHRP